MFQKDSLGIRNTVKRYSEQPKAIPKYKGSAFVNRGFGGLSYTYSLKA